MADAWQQRPHLHRTQLERLPLTLADVDELLTTRSLRPPAFRLVRDGRPLPVSAYTRRGTQGGRTLTDLPDVDRVLDAFREGATIVLQGLHRFFEPVRALCATLERASSHPVQANAYVTPAGASGFAVHHDTHDVLVLQTSGTKRWSIHEPVVELPTTSQPWRRGTAVAAAVLEPELVAGDCLYLPRGTPHAAATASEHSVHLTIGIRVVTGLDVLRAAVDRAAADVRFRRGLPIGYAHDPRALERHVAELLSDASGWLAEVDAAPLADAQVATARRRGGPSRRGELLDVVRSTDVDDATVVRSVANGSRVIERDGRAVLALRDRTLRMPAPVRPVLERLLASGTTRVGDLADALDPDSRVVLVRRLIREGALATVEDATPR